MKLSAIAAILMLLAPAALAQEANKPTSTGGADVAQQSVELCGTAQRVFVLVTNITDSRTDL